MLAERSTCSYRRVGTVITSPDFRKVLAVGYGGNASGLPNRCDRQDASDCGCLHSEENAVINCDAPRDAIKVLFVTQLPCVACAKRLINLGNIIDLYYGGGMPPTEATRMLQTAGIRLHHHPEFRHPELRHDEHEGHEA